MELCATRKQCVPRTRKSIFVPGKFQGAIWQQMHKLHLVKRGVPVHRVTHSTTKRTTPFTWQPPPVSDLIGTPLSASLRPYRWRFSDEILVDKTHVGDPLRNSHVGEEIIIPIKVVYTNHTVGDDLQQGTIIVMGTPSIKVTPFPTLPNPNSSTACPTHRPRV